VVLIRALAKDPSLRFESIGALNDAFQAALATALDPHLRAADAKTHSPERTLAMYQKYQNVRPSEPSARRRRYDRSAVLALLLLLLACVVSAGAVYLVYPEAFVPVAAAPVPTQVDVQATVDFLLTANAPESGPEAPPGAGRDLRRRHADRRPAGGSLPTVGKLTSIRPRPPPRRRSAWRFSTAIHPSLAVSLSRTATPRRTPTHRARDASTATGQQSSPVLPPTSALTLTALVRRALQPPTATASPLPATGTSPPPTSTTLPSSTSPPLSCEWAAASPNVSGDVVSVRVYNNGDLVVTVTNVSITWTGSDHLQRINWRFEGPFWSGNNAGPTVSSGTNKAVPLGTYRTVEFDFWGLSFSGSASVEIEADC
jgi:hypothetical protein